MFEVSCSSSKHCSCYARSFSWTTWRGSSLQEKTSRGLPLQRVPAMVGRVVEEDVWNATTNRDWSATAFSVHSVATTFLVVLSNQVMDLGTDPAKSPCAAFMHILRCILGVQHWTQKEPLLYAHAVAPRVLSIQKVLIGAEKQKGLECHSCTRPVLNHGMSALVLNIPSWDVQYFGEVKNQHRWLLTLQFVSKFGQPLTIHFFKPWIRV